MQLGMIGLGRMGANMVRRLMRGKHSCVVYDRNADNVKRVFMDRYVWRVESAEKRPVGI